MNILFASKSRWNMPERAVSLDTHRVARLIGEISTLAEDIARHNPQVVFLAQYDQTKAFLSFIERLSIDLPAAVIVPVCPNPESGFLIDLMRLNVREVLSDDSESAVADALKRIEARIEAGGNRGERQRRCIAFMSAKGGDGGSCVAANFAAALVKLDPESRVLVIDLSLPFGDIEMYLTSEHSKHDLADFSDEIDRLDAALLDSMVHKISDRFHLITSPPSFDRIMHVHPANVHRLIDIASTHYDSIVIDLGTSIDPIGLQILDRLDQLIIVATLTMPSVRRTSQILGLWETLGYLLSKVSIVINRESGESTIQVSDLEKAIGKRISRVLPADVEGIQESLLKGIPAVQANPRSEYSRLIFEWAGEVSGKPVEEKSIWRRFGIK